LLEKHFRLFPLKKAADDDGKTRIFTDGRQIEAVQAVREQNSSVFGADGKLFAAGGADGRLRFVESLSHKWRSGKMPFPHFICGPQQTLRVPQKKQTISVCGLENDHMRALVRTRTDQQRHSGERAFLHGFPPKELTKWVPAFCLTGLSILTLIANDCVCKLQQKLRSHQKKGTILFIGFEKDIKEKLVKGLGDECIGNVKFQAFELGDHQIVRRVWKHYYAKVDGIVYLVNPAKKDDLAVLKRWLHVLLSDDLLALVPFLILGNIAVDLHGEVGFNLQPSTVSGSSKIDVGTPASADQLCNWLELSYTTGKGKVNLSETNKRPIEVFMWNTLQKMGYEEGIKWLSQYI